ncbi:hypothetical protein ACFLQR_05010 [Verrucomicrobiota bacterium]
MADGVSHVSSACLKIRKNNRQRTTRLKRIKPSLTLCIIALLSIAGFSSATDFEAYKESYEKKLEKIILDHRTKIDELDGQYLKCLNTLGTRAQKQGDLEKVTAVTAETERFIEAQTVSEDVLKDSFPDLKKLQESCIIQVSKLELAKAKPVGGQVKTD